MSAKSKKYKGRNALFIGLSLAIFILIASALSVSAQTSCQTCHPEEYSEFNQSLKKYSFLTCKHCHAAHNDGSIYEYFLVRPKEKICTRCHTSVPGAHNTISGIHDELLEEGCNATCIECHMPVIGKHIENNYSITNHSIKFYTEACITGECHPEEDIAWAKSKLVEMNTTIGNSSSSEVLERTAQRTKGIFGIFPLGIILIFLLLKLSTHKNKSPSDKSETCSQISGREE